MKLGVFVFFICTYFSHAEKVNVKCSSFIFCLFSPGWLGGVCVCECTCMCVYVCVCTCIYLPCGIKFKDRVRTLYHLEKWVDGSSGLPVHRGFSLLMVPAHCHTCPNRRPPFTGPEVLSYFLLPERLCKPI